MLAGRGKTHLTRCTCVHTIILLETTNDDRPSYRTNYGFPAIHTGPIRALCAFPARAAHGSKHGCPEARGTPSNGTLRRQRPEDERAITIRDDLSAVDEQRFLTIGRDMCGRIVVVAYTWRGPAVRIFSARRATPRERRRYLEKDT